MGHSLKLLMKEKMEHLCEDIARSSTVDRQADCEVPKGMPMDLSRKQGIWTVCQEFRGDVRTEN